MDFPDKKTGRDQASRDSASDIISAIGRVFSEHAVLRGAFEEFSRSAAADMDPTGEMVYFAARNPDPRILVHLLKRNPGILSQNFTSIIDSKTAPLIEHVLVNAKEDGVLAVLGDGQLRDHLATTKFPPEGNNILHCLVGSLYGVFAQSSQFGKGFLEEGFAKIREAKINKICNIFPDMCKAFSGLIGEKNSSDCNVLEYFLRQMGHFALIEKEMEMLKRAMQQVKASLVDNDPLISLKSDLVENWHKLQDKVSATGPEKYATQEEAFIAWCEEFLDDKKSKKLDGIVNERLLHGMLERGFKIALPRLLASCSKTHSKALKDGLCHNCLDILSDAEASEDRNAFVKNVLEFDLFDAGNIDAFKRGFDKAIAEGNSEIAHKFLMIPSFTEYAEKRFTDALGSGSKAAPDNLKKVVDVFPEFLDKFAEDVRDFSEKNIEVLQRVFREGRDLKAAEVAIFNKIKALHPEERRSPAVSRFLFDGAVINNNAEEAAAIARLNPDFVSDGVLKFVMTEEKMHNALVSVREENDAPLRDSMRTDSANKLSAEEMVEMEGILSCHAPLLVPATKVAQAFVVAKSATATRKL